MTPTPAVTSLAPWYGAKRTLAPAILPHLGPHHAYWEPFCGSMAVLLAKPPSRQETANDLHGDLVNLARVVADEDLSGRLYWRLRRKLVHETTYRDACGVLAVSGDVPADSGPDIDRAALFFVKSWMGMNGVAGTDKGVNFAKRFTSGGGCPAVRFASAVDSLPDWHERLRRVAIYRADGLALLARIEDAAGVTIYCDPPYIVKSDRYRHDFEPDDHTRLAGLLTRFQRTRVVVSYYDHPALSGLYPGWRVVPLVAHKPMRNPTKVAAGAVAAPEVLLINQPVEPDNTGHASETQT